MEAKKKMCTRVVFAVLPGLLLLAAGCGMEAPFHVGRQQGSDL